MTVKTLSSASRNALICLMLATLGSSCLRTRAQLKDDEKDDNAPAKPTPVQVQDVQPQGGYVIDEVKSEIARLSGRLEELEHAQQQQAQNGSAAKQDDIKKLEARIVELENAQASMLEAIKKIQSSTPPPDNDDLIDKGKDQLNSGDLPGAIESFSSYLKIPKGKHTEEATYLRGEAYYASKQYRKAIVDYSKFPDKYTASKHLPQALLRIGQSFEAMGMKQDAKEFYAHLVEKFPRSSEAKKAKVKLK